MPAGKIPIVHCVSQVITAFGEVISVLFCDPY